ncbi:MAG: Flp pilus assembly protein CpaB [Deltaproteobacteria bacterium]|nr:Flp pilus assembly protein CpaB [Deltaproteobacteria bacterium]MBI3295963.1 Flp pilus assembly protein CpaB [Deltaproteobacteria bacterium]
MENPRPIIISLICFLVSVLLIAGYLRERRAQLTKDFGVEVTVVVANTYIPEYGIIKPDMLTTTKVFKKFVQPQSVNDIEEVLGKAAYVPFYRGEQITLTKLVTAEGKPLLDRQVAKAMRAITISISPFTGVGKLIRPGNRVDVIAAPNYDQGGQLIYEIKTALQNVLVLATGKHLQNEVPTRVDKEVLDMIEADFEKNKRKDYLGGTQHLPTNRPDDNYSNITLQVTPEDAERLLYLTQTFGDRAIYLTLRNSTEPQMDAVPTTILDDVLGTDSDYGRSKKKPLPFVPAKPRFMDLKGGEEEPVN